MLTELIVPARFVPFFRPDLKAKKATDSESVGNPDYFRTLDSSLQFMDETGWSLAEAVARSPLLPVRVRVRWDTEETATAEDEKRTS